MVSCPHMNQELLPAEALVLLWCLVFFSPAPGLKYIPPRLLQRCICPLVFWKSFCILGAYCTSSTHNTWSFLSNIHITLELFSDKLIFLSLLLCQFEGIGSLYSEIPVIHLIAVLRSNGSSISIWLWLSRLHRLCRH